MKNRILLVDGMALLFRGFFATAFRQQFMYNDKGIPTNGVYQFLRYFLDGINTFEPTHVIVCWDMESKTFRTEIYDNYKANRDAPPKELIPQFDLAKEAVDLFNIPNIGIENYEADDIIGTLAKRYHHDAEVIIQTGDLDMLQLVDDQIDVAIMRKGLSNYEVFNKINFLEKKGVSPEQITEFKGLTGDSADNYPGIKGIGEKTALKLLKEYETMDNILLNIDSHTKGIQTKLINDIDNFHLSKQLAEIKSDLDVDLQLDSALWEFEKSQLNGNLAEIGIRPMNLNFLENK
ncbi:MAG TPA: 5'-3' exonuclease [Pseudogracilibacillus sp.]|nr:5'-3' exonuclease [Pseudogracilibacillus sp.]